MILIAMIISIIVGGVLGLILYLTSNNMFFKSKAINSISGFIINVIRSIPYNNKVYIQ